jgi:hypothetical protein
MITIRPEQFQCFDKVSADEYHRDLAKFFRTNSPKLVERMDDTTLVNRTRILVDLSRSFGIASPEGTAAYVALGLGAGPSFDTDPSVCGFLRMPGASPEIKIRALFERVANRREHGNG